MSRRIWAVSVSTWVICAGCAGPFCPNGPLVDYQPEGGYRFDTLEPGENNTDDLFICLTFSGGGTRAAAFAYGVLQGLREVEVAARKGGTLSRNLLDEVDVISSVSGGSFTAMGYGLWREGMFDGRFEKRFLKRNVELDLVLGALRPKNIIRLPFFILDSIDIAATYYDQRIFDERTYADLLEQGTRPFIVVNAADVARRQRFQFTQEDFDLLGSDLSSLPVGWAVAASSAYPILLSPLRLKYHPGDASSSAIEGVMTAPEDLRSPRRYRWAASLIPDDGNDEVDPYAMDGERHKFLYLLDGGLADNLGLSHVIESYRLGAIRRRIEAGRVRRFVVIIVNACSDPPTDIESRRVAPGLLTVGERIATTSIYTNSETLTGTVKHIFLEAHSQRRQTYREYENVILERCPDATVPQPPAADLVEYYVIELNFRQFENESLARRFLSTVTSFFLPGKRVDELIKAGRNLLEQHPEFRRLLADLQEEGSQVPTGLGIGASTGMALRRSLAGGCERFYHPPENRNMVPERKAKP
jgi:NTE family protein